MLSKLGDDSRFMQLLFNNLPIHLKLSHTQVCNIILWSHSWYLFLSVSKNIGTFCFIWSQLEIYPDQPKFHFVSLSTLYNCQHSPYLRVLSLEASCVQFDIGLYQWLTSFMLLYYNLIGSWWKDPRMQRDYWGIEKGKFYEIFTFLNHLIYDTLSSLYPKAKYSFGLIIPSFIKKCFYEKFSRALRLKMLKKC